MTRKEIEEYWVRVSDMSGDELCFFIPEYMSKDAFSIWKSTIWVDIDVIYIDDYFHNDSNIQSFKDCQDMTYLCRALSLNMFLDDNNIK